MATPKIIALYSPVPQSGKSLLADFFEAQFQYQKISIATPIKIVVRQLLLVAGIDPARVNDLMFHAKQTPIPRLGNKSVRELCQTLGKEWGRETVALDLWVNIALERMRPNHHYIIDDIRFPNEYHAIKARGGEVWKILRPCATLPNNHPSEGQLDLMKFDRVLINDGTKEQLYQQLILPKGTVDDQTLYTAA